CYRFRLLHGSGWRGIRRVAVKHLVLRSHFIELHVHDNIQGYALSAVRVRNDYGLLIVQNSREGEHTRIEGGNPKVLAVSRNRPEVKAPVTKRRTGGPQIGRASCRERVGGSGG